MTNLRPFLSNFGAHFRMRSDAVASIARVNEIYSPRDSIKKKKKTSRLNEMYLFDMEMEDKVIDTTINLPGLNRDHQYVKPNSETKRKVCFLISYFRTSDWLRSNMVASGLFHQGNGSKIFSNFSRNFL